MTELEKLSLSQPLTDVYNAMEQDIMLAIAKQLAKDGSISASSEWRLQRLAEAGDLNKTVIGIIASYTGIQSDLLTETLSGAANSIIDKLEPGFRELAKQGFISDTPVPASKSVNRAIQTFHKQAASDLNLVNTVMRYKAKQAYVDLVNKTYDAVNAIEDVSNRQELLNALGKHTMSTVMGAESRQEAVRKCIREFNSKGIPAFVDAAGREWSPEAYINMDIRTTVSNTANAAQDARCDDYGIDLIAVSSHPGARPKCAKDQGKVYSRSNKSGIAHDDNGKEIHYEPLSSTSYGEPDGLFGINCRHKKYPFIDGVNFQRYFPYDKEENDKRYKEIQEQRRLERKVRNTKREADMLNEVGDTEGAKAARAKLKEQRKAYRTYCDEHELTQRNDRLTVSKTSSVSRSNAGTSAGNAPKASFAKAAEVNVPAPASLGKAYTGEKIVKPLDNGGGSGIMKERKSDINNARIGITDSSSTAPINNSTKIGSQLFTEDNYKIMLQHERIISGNNYETAIIYYPDGGVNFKKKGDLDTVKFTANERKKMNGCVATHNHPNGTVQSPDDIMMLRTVNLSEIRACNSKGAYVVTPPSKWSKEIDSLEKLNEKYLDFYEAAMSKYRDVSAQEGKPLFLYLKTAEEEGLRDFCECYGFGYRWEEK